MNSDRDRWVTSSTIAVALTALAMPPSARAASELDDAALDTITAHAAVQTIDHQNRWFQSVPSSSPALLASSVDIETIESAISPPSLLAQWRPSYGVDRSVSGFNEAQVAASAQASATGRATRTSTSTSATLDQAGRDLSGSAVAAAEAFAGPEKAVSETLDRSRPDTGATAVEGKTSASGAMIEAKMSLQALASQESGTASVVADILGTVAGQVTATLETKGDVFARGDLGVATITMDLANADAAAQTTVQQRLRASAAGDFVTAHAFYVTTSCCTGVSPAPTASTTIDGPYTMRTGWFASRVDGHRATTFGSLFLLATDLRLSPGIPDNTLTPQLTGFVR